MGMKPKQHKTLENDYPALDTELLCEIRSEMGAWNSRNGTKPGFVSGKMRFSHPGAGWNSLQGWEEEYEDFPWNSGIWGFMWSGFQGVRSARSGWNGENSGGFGAFGDSRARQEPGMSNIANIGREKPRGCGRGKWQEEKGKIRIWKRKDLDWGKEKIPSQRREKSGFVGRRRYGFGE